MSFLAAIPVIGGFLSKVFDGIDSITTSDEERLQFKTTILEAQVPLLTDIVQADAELQKARVALETAALQSDKFLVYSLRPILSYATFFYYMATSLGAVSGDPDKAFYAFGLVFGIFGVSRGAEKMAKIFKKKEGI